MNNQLTPEELQVVLGSLATYPAGISVAHWGFGEMDKDAQEPYFFPRHVRLKYG